MTCQVDSDKAMQANSSHTIPNLPKIQVIERQSGNEGLNAKQKSDKSKHKKTYNENKGKKKEQLIGATESHEIGYQRQGPNRKRIRV